MGQRASDTLPQSKYVLVVDDDRDVRVIIELALRYAGVTVEVAENGAIALERLRNANRVPCLILLDLMMPVMDGWTFARTIGSDEQLKTIPIVLMTAFEAGEQDLPTASHVLRKPVSLAEIRGAVEKYCDSEL